jgi:hypothetical protein
MAGVRGLRRRPELPMQQDDLEVTFCDLCGASVPAADLDNETAVRHQGKVVGACCLGALRGSAPGVAARPAETRPMLVGVVLLFALAAATMFLDHRITGADAAMRAQHTQLTDAQRSDSDVLQAIGAAMDGAARRADLDSLAERLQALEASVQSGREQARQDAEQARQEMGLIRQEGRDAAASAVDYRPLFDDLRRQLQRQAAELAELRSVPAGAAPAPVEPAPAEVPEGGAAEPALPGALGEQVKRLQSTDPAIRFEAVDELLRSKEAAVLPHLLPLARDPDSFVRRLTIEGLRDWKRPEVVETLLVGMGDADENVRDTAWRSLREVTGQKFPFEATASKDARARAQQRWQEWWDKNKVAFGS